MSSLYDDDILLWSEQQAAAIRRLGRNAHEIPNELDIENVAEEIESVGGPSWRRSQWAASLKRMRRNVAHHLRILARLR